MDRAGTIPRLPPAAPAPLRRSVPRVPALLLGLTLATTLFRPPCGTAAASSLAAAATATATATATAQAFRPTEARILAEMAALGTNAIRLYQLGDICHDAGVAGDKKAVERAETYLRQILALEATNAPALALLGSVYTMKGRDAFWPTAQLRLVHEGNRYMDQAVTLAPDNPRVRITRAFNNAHMPEFLGRTETVRTDLAWLLDRASKDPAAFTTSERQEMALHWGRHLRRQRRAEEARTIWETALALAPDSRIASEIRTDLSKLK